MNVNRYQFDKIVQVMKNEIGSIRKGRESEYEGELRILEQFLYESYPKYHVNGRQLSEIMKVVLWDIKSYMEHTEYDYSKWMEDLYREYADEIETLFLPDKNKRLENILRISPDSMSSEERKEYLKLPAKCIIRVLESIEMWTKERGADGYYNFIEEFFGQMKYIDENPVLIKSDYLK